MNKQKFLEDRYTERNLRERKTDSLFDGIECEECHSIHGTKIAGGVK